MREFVPFDDRWFDSEPPGPLVPLPANYTCKRCRDGVFHWVPEGEGKLENVITSPLRRPNFAATPALSSNT